jgi:hypothetical protein
MKKPIAIIFKMTDKKEKDETKTPIKSKLARRWELRAR